MYQHKLGPEKKVCSVIIAHFWALKAIEKFGVSHCSKYRAAFCHFAIALHFALALLVAIAIAVMIRSS